MVRGMDGDWNGEVAVPATVGDRSNVDWSREKVTLWIEEKRNLAKAKVVRIVVLFIICNSTGS